MTSVEEQNYFPAIHEQLESKNLVTFKWLSRKYKIHCTSAKRILSEFISKSSKDTYSVTYLVFQKDSNGNLIISLSDENDFSDSDGSTTIFEKQIYSIERSSSNVSTDFIYNDDKLTFELEQMNLSSINYPSKVIKNPISRRYNVASDDKKKTEEKSNVEQAGSSVMKVETKKGKINKLNFTSLPKSNNEDESVPKVEEKSTVKVHVKKESESKASNTKDIKKANGKGTLSALFQNHRVKNVVTSTANTSKNENEENTEKKESKEKNESAETVTERVSPSNQSIKRNTPVKASKGQKTSKKNTVRAKKKPEKKNRKRIQTAFDSSEESGSDAELSERESPFDDVEEESEPQPEPEKSIEPVPSAAIVLGKKRKRKVLDKSVLGDDGFFYTDKEVVYESCDSDDNDENDPNVKQESNKRLKSDETDKNSASVSKTKTVLPVVAKPAVKTEKAKTKQASIMNFFKKS